MPWQKPQPKRPWTPMGTRKIVRQQSANPEKPRDWRDLAHPDLQTLTDPQFAARSDWLSCVINQVPQEDRIGWYGGMLRTWKGGDGGQGAWMTEAQAAAWKDRADMGSVGIG